MYAEPVASRPMTARSTLYQHAGTSANTNFYYQLPNGIKGPLPADLVSKRTPANGANGFPQYRGPSGGQPTTPARPLSNSTDAEQVTISALSRSPAKNFETVVWQYEAPPSNNALFEEYADPSKVTKRWQVFSALFLMLGRSRKLPRINTGRLESSLGNNHLLRRYQVLKGSSVHCQKWVSIHTSTLLYNRTIIKTSMAENKRRTVSSRFLVIPQESSSSLLFILAI